MVGKSLKLPILWLIHHDQQGVGNDFAFQNSKLKSTKQILFWFLFHWKKKYKIKKCEIEIPEHKFCLVFVEKLRLISCCVHQSSLLADQATDVGFYYLRIYLPVKFRNIFAYIYLWKHSLEICFESIFSRWKQSLEIFLAYIYPLKAKFNFFLVYIFTCWKRSLKLVFCIYLPIENKV